MASVNGKCPLRVRTSCIRLFPEVSKLSQCMVPRVFHFFFSPKYPSAKRNSDQFSMLGRSEDSHECLPPNNFVAFQKYSKPKKRKIKIRFHCSITSNTNTWCCCPCRALHDVLSLRIRPLSPPILATAIFRRLPRPHFLKTGIAGKKAAPPSTGALSHF